MKITIVAVGLKQPQWADIAVADYLSRFPSDWNVELKVVKSESRTTKSIPKVMVAEAARIRSVIPRGALIVVLDERGKDLTTEALSKQITVWKDAGEHIAFIIGGADGIDHQLKQESRFLLRLSSLTLPHAMVRVFLVEQIYRVWSLMNNHPYHRA